MADSPRRLPGNVPGAFHVTDACIDCDICRVLAPEVFQRREDIGLSVVHHQPATPAELQAAREALEECPTGAIVCRG